jgi:hypothetical protein
MNPADRVRVHAALNSGGGTTAWIPTPATDLRALLGKGAVASDRRPDGSWTHRPATRENTAVEGDPR